MNNGLDDDDWPDYEWLDKWYGEEEYDLEEPDEFDLAPLEMNLDEDAGMKECPHCNGSGELWFDLIDGAVSIDCSHCASVGWVQLPVPGTA